MPTKIKIAVIDVTGAGRSMSSIFIDGKILKSELRRMALNSLGLQNSEYFEIEIKDDSGATTKVINSKCTIFVKSTLQNKKSSLFGDDFKSPFKGTIFEDIFKS